MELRPALSVLLVTFFFCVSVLAEQPKGEDEIQAEAVRFVDLDGDGLNDNAPDNNGDGIPEFESDKPPAPQLTMRGNVSGVFTQLPVSNDLPISLSLSNSTRFKQLQFCTRALSSCRGGFTSGDEFGPGNGIGQSALSGNCVGGVCH